MGMGYGNFNLQSVTCRIVLDFSRRVPRKARNVMDTMKAGGKWQWKLLSKIIESVELANGLTNSFDALGRRELKNAFHLLADRKVDIPFNIRIAASKRCVAFMLEDLMDALGKGSNKAEPEKVLKDRMEKQTELLKSLMNVLAVWVEPNTAWSFSQPCFSMLAAELHEELKNSDEQMDDDAYEEMISAKFEEIWDENTFLHIAELPCPLCGKLQLHVALQFAECSGMLLFHILLLLLIQAGPS